MSRVISVQRAIEEIRAGRQIILVDDEDRENEGDLCMAAELVRAEDINFMATHGRGLICLTLDRERVERLGLPRMSERNASPFGTAFHVSIEARHGVTTGISAADRATTIRAAVAPDAGPESIVSPGHVFPICAREGGVLVRCGQTEGSVDLARLAGLAPAGVICEIMNEDGTMARRPDLEAFAERHGLGILTIAQLIRYRLERERLVRPVAASTVTPEGASRPWRMTVFEADVSRACYVALTLGELDRERPTLVRMHRAALAGDVFGIARRGPARPVAAAMRMIEQEGSGAIVYVLPEEIDALGEMRRLLAPERAPAASPPRGAAAHPRLRDFGLGAQVLVALGLGRIRLISDNPKRIAGLEGYGLEVVEQVPFSPARAEGPRPGGNGAADAPGAVATGGAGGAENRR